jgi:hypothetical protein
MNEKTNKYNNTHIGNQPIRVLQGYLISHFENTIENSLMLASNTINSVLKPGIEYVVNEKAIMEKIDEHYQTPFVNSNGQIYIHETFTSYVWCISYVLLTLYDEKVAKPSKHLHESKEVNVTNDDQIKKSLKVFKYALSIIKDFTIWNKEELPNPELYAVDQEWYIEKTNSLYLCAMNFILCHEFAHVEKGHIKLKRTMLEDDQIWNSEIEADARSIELILECINNENKTTVHIGTLIGLCCLLFLGQKASFPIYPDMDERIDKLLNSLQLDDSDTAWGVAALAFKLWDDQYEKLYSWSIENLSNYKELYYSVKKQIEEENKWNRS